MATVYRYEDLLVWQESRSLSTTIYKKFLNNRDYDFKSQIQRAAVSIMNNIAEGFDRNKIDETNKSFIYFLDIAYGSCGEVNSMTYLAEDLLYLTSDEALDLRKTCYSLSSKLYAFIQTLKNNPKPLSPK